MISGLLEAGDDSFMDLPLFAPRPDEPERSKLERAFWKFHADNPAVYAALKRLAFQWQRTKGGRVGIATLFECVRWEISLETAGNDEFKLNNNHRAFYARLLMTNEPELTGLFLLRRQTMQASIGPEQETLASGKHVA